jgi:thiamine biosynthesis lipoprotein
MPIRSKARVFRDFLVAGAAFHAALACGGSTTAPQAAAPPADRASAVGPPSAAAAASSRTLNDAAKPALPHAASTPRVPSRVEVKDSAMGTTLTFIVYTNQNVDEAAARAAIARAVDEMRRLEGLMSEWRADSEIGRLNAQPGEWLNVSPATLEVVEKSLWAGKVSNGVFDITFQSMSGLWKFGSDSDSQPKLPAAAAVAAAKKWVDYRKIEVDSERSALRIGKQQKIGLGGIAKGYIVDRAASLLKSSGLDAFLVQAGGDLYGAGKKPDGSHWVSGIQDPRAAQGSFFATLELEDHAFSTAGDYARSYVIGKKRYHHIIDPRTGYPATACRSVTVWAKDAFVADAIDDAVFILGPERGLELVESIDDAGAVIVDRLNRVWISKRLEGRVTLLSKPTDGI